MAAKVVEFGKQPPKRNTKRNLEPMYMRSKYITMSGNVLMSKTPNPSPSAWRASHDCMTDEKLFLERRDLIGQWFKAWDDTQRKRFFDFILDRSAYSELKFILGWFKKPVRSQVDFVSVLPRVLSTHLFSFLDPRSLCRAASVSWHWKWLVEQDIIWKRKCLKFGWYLPYKPSELENGAWKKHYVMCIQTINVELPKKSDRLQDPVIAIAKKFAEKSNDKGVKKAFRKWKKIVPLVHTDEPLRRPWVSNSFRPKELELADRALFRKTSETKSSAKDATDGNPQYPRSLGKHTRSRTTPGQVTSQLDSRGQESLRRTKSEELPFSVDERSSARMTLSETIQSEIFHQTDGMEVGDSEQNNGFPETFKPKSIAERPVMCESDCGSLRLDGSQVYTTCASVHSLQEFSLAYPNVLNPRVVFISSEIPACELLVNAILYGVLPIIYQFEGTTLCGLLEHFTAVLQGRKARSVGFFVGGQSGSIDLVRGSSLTVSTLTVAEMEKFWQALCMDILSEDEGGHVDVFYPLGGTDAGIELLAQLQILTGITFSSPTRTASSIFKVGDDWLPVQEDESPSKIYFNEVKFLAWVRAAEYIEECMVSVRREIYDRLDDERHGLATKVIGEIMFKACGLLEIREMQKVSKVLVQALVLMTQQKEADKVNLTNCLVQCLRKCQKDGSPRKKRARNGNERAPLDEKEPSESRQSDLDEDSDEGERDWKSDSDLMNSSLAERLTLGERRSVLAHEILSSERDYCHTLAIVQDVFRKPLEASVKSNRQVIGSANIRMIFDDSETLLKISKELTSDLSRRLQEWDSHQCLGDVFLKFNTKLKAYMNFLNNYPITLATIEKCQKQHPAFRGFLLQLEKQPNTKLMSLQTLLLAPTKRIQEYVCLLETLLHHTPVEHKDHNKLKKAIEQLKQLRNLFDEASTRLRRERHLTEVQKRINNCPALVERGRYFIKQEDVVHLRQAKSSDVKPEFRVFQNIGNIGLFLFNDCLVVTTKDLLSLPFQRTLEASYKYHSTLPLSTIKLEEVIDSKYVQNAFMIVTNKRQWICQAKTNEAKVNWVSLLNSSKRSTLQAVKTIFNSCG